MNNEGGHSTDKGHGLLDDLVAYLKHNCLELGSVAHNSAKEIPLAIPLVKSQGETL